MQHEAGYVHTANTLADRILALIPAHPEILTMDSPWPLFKVPGFTCDDIGPSYAQACAALGAARARYQEQQPR